MFALPIPILLMLTIVFAWGKSVLGGYYAKRLPDAARYRWLFGLIQSVTCGGMIALILGLSGGLGSFSLASVLIGLVMGLANIFGLVTGLAAMERGPFSYTTVIISLSTVITALSGPFFGEGVPSVTQFIGILLMIVCLFCAPERKAEDTKKTSAAWLLLCGASMICSGATGISQKIHQKSDYASEMAALLLVTFAVSAVFSAIMLIVGFCRKSNKPAPTKASNPFPLILTTSAVSGAIFAFPHTINLFLSGVMPSVVMFPLVNLCPMLLSMVTGIVLFRERLSPMRWAGVAIGILATVLISGVL